MEIARPRSLSDALALLAQPGARAVAGGTALHLQWAQGAARPDILVRLDGLVPAGITLEGARAVIGAATTLHDLAAADLPLLSRAARDVAAQNIRRLATLGGTLGFGAGCLIPALLVLGAQVVTTGGMVALADWLAAPAGLVLSVHVTQPGPEATLVWRKTGLRAGFTPAIIVAAAVRDGATLRLAVGGGVVPPRLVPADDLAGLDRDRLETALRARIHAPGCAFRSGAYRARVAARALAWGLTGLAEAPPTHGTPLPGALTRDSARWHIRPDMAAKVTGTLPYLTDARQEGMLIGRILRAAHPHAAILAIDTSAAEALPGVRAVVTHRDIPGQNAFGIVFQDQPALCHDKVRYPGDAVAAVAATDAATADRALALIRVDYAALPVVTDPLAALAPDAPPVHAQNLVTTIGLTRGDTEAAFATAAHVVEETYITPRQMHGFMETEGGYASPLPGGGLLMAVGGQHGARDRLQLSRILAIPEDRIRVITSPTGGAFGGKDELTVQPALALLALKAGAPVRLHLSRADSVIAGTKRNPMTIRMKTACDAEGRLIAQEVDLLADCGAYASLSPGVVETAMEHAAGPYRIANLRTRGRLAYTNNGTCGAFRGFGANQMTHAVECQIDRLARLTGLTPAEIRRRNLRVPGSPGYLGQRIAGSERLEEMLALADASPLWAAADGSEEWAAGTGMALMWQGNGLGTVPPDDAAGELRLSPDGRVEILCGLDEMGQGLHASLVAAVADRLGCARADVRPVTGDTGLAPDAGSTTASRGGYVVWKTVDLAAPDFAAALIAAAERVTGLTGLRIVPGGLARPGRNDGPDIAFADLAVRLLPQGLPVRQVAFAFPKTDYTPGNARLIFAGGATVARVAVSRITGAVRVTALHLHTAAGPVIDLASYLGQMEGGAVQGLGFALTEDALMHDGRYVTANLDTYMLPSVRDRPLALAVTALEDLDPGDPYGPRGAGELGIGGISPAIANAVAAALGRCPPVTPLPPEAVLDCLP